MEGEKMKTINKIIILLLVLGVLVGCNKDKEENNVDWGEVETEEFVYDMYDGEVVTVSINKESNYRYVIEDPYFFILDAESDEQLLNGEFIGAGAYIIYKGFVEDESEVESTLLDHGTTDEGNEYIFWEYDGGDFVQYNYALLIGESDHGVLMGSDISKEVAENVFSNMRFKLGEPGEDGSNLEDGADVE